jgi:hypothetical protein
MTPQPDRTEPPRLSKVKGKGARRVSNLSEEQRNKKRENDRIAQQNIRRRNKELIEKLQHEVNTLKKRQDATLVKQVMNQNKRLEAEVCILRKTLEMHTGRPYHGPGAHLPRLYLSESRPGIPADLQSDLGVDVEDLPIGGHMGEYDVPHAYGSPYGGGNVYDQWPSNVVPVPATVTVNSAESSPRPSGPGEDFTPTYGHAGVPMTEGRVMTAHTSAPSLESAKAKYEEPDGGPSTDRYTNHGGQQSSTYLQEPPWSSGYPPSTYYAQATGI